MTTKDPAAIEKAKDLIASKRQEAERHISRAISLRQDANWLEKEFLGSVRSAYPALLAP